MEEFRHFHPHERKADQGDHVLELTENGERIGSAYFKYYGRPFPAYEIEMVAVDRSKRGEGYGSEIMNSIEEMLKEKGKIGFLQDAIDDDSPAKGMYRRRGWIPILNTSYLAYNVPDTIPPERLQEFESRLYNKTREKRLEDSFKILRGRTL